MGSRVLEGVRVSWFSWCSGFMGSEGLGFSGLRVWVGVQGFTGPGSRD